MNSIGNGYYNEDGITASQTENKEKFNFKFISQNEFKSIYKSVQRRRRDEHEKRQWDLFIKKKVEEENKKEDVKRNVDTSVQCSGCYWTNPQQNGIPMTYNSHYDDLLETSGEPFSLQLPTTVNENIDSSPTLSQTDLSEKIKELYSLNLSTAPNPENKSYAENFDNQTKDKEEDDNHEKVNSIALEYEFNKIDSLRTKILPLLRNIHKLILKERDFSDEDTERIKMRATEFSNRFKRNYLYQVQCIKKEIEKIMNDKSKSLVKETLAQKFVSAYQCCLQNLQVIEKSLPKIKIESIFNLLKDFFICFYELTVKLNLIFGDRLKQKTEDIVTLCEQIMDSMVYVIKEKPEPKKKIIKKEKKKVKDNLWMYSSKNSWASKATALAKTKLAAKNQHTVQKVVSPKDKVPSTSNEPTRSLSYTQEMLLLNQKSKLNIRNRDPVKEDEIKTMVEMTAFNETDISDVNDEELQIDVGPMLVEEENINEQLTSEEIQNKDTSPPKSPKLSKASFQNKVSSEKNQTGIKNVAFICIQSDTKERDITPEELSENLESKVSTEEHLEDEEVIEEEAVEEDEEIYRMKLRKCREKMGANDTVLDNVTRISESILKESFHEAVNCSSLETILTNLIIADLVDK